MMWNPIIHSTGTIDPKVVITLLDCFGALGVIIVVLEGHKYTIKWETNLISIPWSRRRYCLIIFGLVILKREYSKSAVSLAFRLSQELPKLNQNGMCRATNIDTLAVPYHTQDTDSFPQGC